MKFERRIGGIGLFNLSQREGRFLRGAKGNMPLHLKSYHTIKIDFGN